MLQLKSSAAHIHSFCFNNNSNFKNELTPCICQLGKTNWLGEKDKQIHHNLVGQGIRLVGKVYIK